MNSSNSLNGKQRAAMFIVSLGPEKSAKIFKHLKESEIEELTLEIANIKTVSPKLKEQVMREFYELCLAQEYISEGGIGYAKKVLEESLGNEKAVEVLNKLTTSLQVRPFEFARKADPSQLINFIQNEHPQTIALILSYLKPSQAATILSALNPELQAETTKRIALMDRAYPEMVAEIEREFEKKLSTVMSEEYTIIGGLDAVVEMINLVDRSTEKNIMEQLEVEAPELADDIKKRMFVFEDITTLDNKSIQRVLRDVDNRDLAIALKGTSQQVKQAILNNVSKRQSQTILEELEFMGPKRMKEIEEAQQKIVGVIRTLEEQEQIIISRGEGDDLIV